MMGFDSASHPSSFYLHPELAMLDHLLDSITEGNSLDTSFLWSGVDSIFFAADTVPSQLTDTTTSSQPTSTSITVDILKNRLVPIQFPDSSHAALSSFFSALVSGKSNSTQIRVMHYGDSQIEGDRITSFLRLRLQTRFGGTGVGLLHAVPHSYQPGAVYQTASSNWRQILVADLARGAVGHRFGLLGGYSAFTQTKSKQKGGFNEAWIRFERRGKHSNPRNFKQCRIFYGHSDEPFMLSLKYGGKAQDGEMIAPTSSMQQISWEIPQSENTFQLNFKGDESPLVYGVSLESPTGIIVDNIAIRGSSGIDFTRADDKSLREALQLVKPKLVILQFGVNVVPHIVDSYKYYENQMYRQIKAIKMASPSTSVLLIGVSDMSQRHEGQYVSYPNIEQIRDAQRQAALRAGAAFWDCYEAMGGNNSMPAWAFATPPLASKDFVHFTLRGSKLIAEMFYSSLMESFREFEANAIKE
jgi:lysophospholipase L1-like esterase